MRRIIIIVLLLFLTACSCGKPNIIQGERDSFDTNDDGVDDTFTLTYDKEEVADDVYLIKSIELTDTEGTITLEFEGDNQAVYREAIPKSFAEHVDELEFSVQPRVINPDPEVEWDIDIKDEKAIIQIKVKGKKPVTDVFDQFDLKRNVEICDKLPEGDKQVCYSIAVGALKEPKPSHCRALPVNEDMQIGCILGIAVLTKDVNICAELKEKDVQSQCLTSVAAITKDKELCNKVKDLGMKSLCEVVVEAQVRGVPVEDVYQEKIKAVPETISLTPEECNELKQGCEQDCGEKCEQLKYDYCRKHEYSGCALDVFCSCDACKDVYNVKWCGYESFLGCAEGAMGKYETCIKGYQAKRDAGQDVSNAGECRKEFLEQLGGPCKNDACVEFCQLDNFKTGKWATYTQEFGYDSCACE
ncbi:hypothetical protein KY330_05320 [Candidatus Woesearchaeota archaeon]|nr:hypothetical protein [Candidatus Woesearchaeota archaeon]